MRIGFKIIFTFCLLTSFCLKSYAALGPAMPTDNVFTKVKKPESTTQNLPYDVSAHPIDEEDFGETDEDLGDVVEPIEESKKEVIDWTLVPYVPFKRVELTPAPDPEIE